MSKEVKKRGRPPKNGVAKPEFLLRSIMIIHAYQKARARGGKHSAAVKEAVDFVRLLVPEMPISETIVRRSLSEFQPQHSPFALRVDYSVLGGEEVGDQDQERRPHRFTFGFDKHPNYPRHNAKSPST